MAKKPRKLTDQEALVTTFARHSISAGSTFHPDQWSTGREPADMVIVIGRALIFFNMTKGRSYFPTLCEHNISQARLRMEEWRGGKSIRGRNEWRKFAISWNDVDVIHLVSVVDGPHAACLAHDPDGQSLNEKVKICTSLTSGVVRELAERGGGARDLIEICKQLRGRGPISDTAGRRLVRRRYKYFRDRAEKGIIKYPSRIGRALVNGKYIDFFDEFMMYFVRSRNECSKGEEFDLLSNVSWGDIIPAVGYILNSISEIEGLPYGSFRFKVHGQAFKFMVFVSTNINSVSSNIDSITSKADLEGAQFLWIINIARAGIMPVLIFRRGDCINLTQIDIDCY